MAGLTVIVLNSGISVIGTKIREEANKYIISEFIVIRGSDIATTDLNMEERVKSIYTNMGKNHGEIKVATSNIDLEYVF